MANISETLEVTSFWTAWLSVEKRRSKWTPSTAASAAKSISPRGALSTAASSPMPQSGNAARRRSMTSSSFMIRRAPRSFRFLFGRCPGSLQLLEGCGKRPQAIPRDHPPLAGIERGDLRRAGVEIDAEPGRARGAAPCARNPAIAPLRTSPLPAVACPGWPWTQTPALPSGLTTTVGAPLCTTVTPVSRTSSRSHAMRSGGSPARPPPRAS